MHPPPRCARHILLMWLQLAALPNASAQTDTIHGRISSPRDVAVAGARVSVSAVPDGIVRRARTDDEGMFTIAIPGRPASYTVEVTALGFMPRRFELRRSGESNDFPADARMEMSTATLPPLRARAARRRPARDAEGDGSTGADRRTNLLGVAAGQHGDIAAMAASALGADLVPGSEGFASGFSVLGLSASQNATTLDGLAFGGTELPSTAPVSMSVSTGPYDVSRGGFSGAQVVLRSRRGTNYVTRLLSGSVEDVRHTAGGLLAGPIVYAKAFYAFSFQLGRRSSELRTLLDMNAGTAVDSVPRLLATLRALSIPVSPERHLRRAVSDNGSVFGSFDVIGPTRTTGHALSLTYAGNWNRQAPSFLSPTDLPTRGARRTSLNGAVQGRHTGYLDNGSLSETLFGLGISRSGANPFFELPTGNVMVRSPLPDGTMGHQVFSFGGALRSSRQSSIQWSGRNQLSWYSMNERHLFSISTELRHERVEQAAGGNEHGAFTFESLEALAAAQPSSFNRSMPAPPVREGQWSAAVSLGDRYTPVDALELQYGMRLDANRFSTVPSHNAAVAELFGMRTDVVPNYFYMSPRLGFSWMHGSAASAPSRRARLQGGIGIFQGLPATSSIASALSNTGLATAVRSIACTGSAVPVPDWARYVADAGSIPSACEGASAALVATGRAPSVVLYRPEFRAPRSIRGNVQWRWPLHRVIASVEGTYSLNFHEPSGIDVNLRDDTQFTLPNEAGRPVFVPSASINPSSGWSDWLAARRSEEFAHVTALRSNARSVSRQFSIVLEPTRSNRYLDWNVGYVHSTVRERHPGFGEGWTPADRDWRHQAQYTLSINPRDLVRITWFGSIRSGLPFTPLVAGDVNGDGYSNDRAFVFGPSSGDSTMAAGMRTLLDNASSGTRTCLTAQENQLASRASCRGPWSSTSHLTMRINPVRLRLPGHAAISLKLSSPLGALDRWLHGESGTRGWDAVAFPSSTLLHVRGFDAATRQFRYDVNPRFGTTDRALAAQLGPPRLTLLFALDAGPAQERQVLTRDLERGRRTSGETATAESLRRALGAAMDLPNPMAAILRRAATLALTAPQADSIAAMHGAYATLLRTVWNPVWSALGRLPRVYDEGEAYALYRAAREASVDRLILLAPVVLDLLSAEQRGQLGDDVRNGLDESYLRSIRSGTVSQGIRGMVH